MSVSLDGSLCVVTGASSGIGQAITEALARAGGRVIAGARRFEGRVPAVLPAPGEIAAVRLDVTDEAQVRACFGALPRVDVLVNAAGAGCFGPFADMDVAALRAMLEVHVVGTFLCCREALRIMQPRRSGHIVTIGSISATRAFADCAGYSASKAGQAALTRVLAEEARAHEVRITNLTVGAVDTAIWDQRPGFDRARMMQAADVAGVVVDVVTRPGVAVEELMVMPPAGVL